jgi:hypothetical protein
MVAIVLSLLLQGCLLDRLEQSRNQLCRGQVHLSLIDGVVVSFDRPTLYDTDIVKILGEAPSGRYKRGDDLVYEYRAAKLGDSSGDFDIPVVFTFAAHQGRNKLTEAQIDKETLGGLSHNLIEHLFRSACSAKIVGKSVQIDMTGIDAALLPDRKTVWRLMGAPNSIDDNRHLFWYILNDEQTCEIRISFDAQKGRVSAIKIIYFRYVVDLDFETQLAVGTMKSWRDYLKLGALATFSP